MFNLKYQMKITSYESVHSHEKNFINLCIKNQGIKLLYNYVLI